MLKHFIWYKMKGAGILILQIPVILYLRWLIGDCHALSLCVTIFKILSSLAALHSD